MMLASFQAHTLFLAFWIGKKATFTLSLSLSLSLSHTHTHTQPTIACGMFMFSSCTPCACCMFMFSSCTPCARPMRMFSSSTPCAHTQFSDETPCPKALALCQRDPSLESMHLCVLHLGHKALHPRSMPHAHVQLLDRLSIERKSSYVRKGAQPSVQTLASKTRKGSMPR